MNIIQNLRTCRWYQIFKSHGFTINGESINATLAFMLFQKDYDVKYRDIFLKDIFESVYDTQVDNSNYFLVCGYIEGRDLFVSLKYTVVDKISNDCSICLSSLNEDFPVRIYGARCFHDIHMKCLNNLKRNSGFPCCAGMYDFTSHTSITDICLSKLTVNVFGKHCFGWRDLYKVKNDLTFPEDVIHHLHMKYPTFVKFCAKPYHNTVHSYHTKWMFKNRVRPV